MALSKSFVAPERVVERGRGCWSCSHFSNDKLARDTWRLHRANALAQLQLAPAIKSSYVPAKAVLEASRLAQQGLPEAMAVEQAIATSAPNQGDLRLQRVQQVDRDVLNGTCGLCMAGGVATDFVYSKHLCEKWSGRTGASIATGGKAGKLDKLSDELNDLMDDRIRRKGG